MYLRVDGMPPTSTEHMGVLLRHVAAGEVIDDLDAAWPDGTVIPLEADPRTRLTWHIEQLRLLLRVLELPDLVASVGGHLADLGVSTPGWVDDAVVQRLSTLVEAVDAQAEAKRAGTPLTDLVLRLREDVRPVSPDAHRALGTAVAGLDVIGYAAAWAELDELHARAEELAELDALSVPVTEHLPGLVDALRVTDDGPLWRERLTRFEAAWDRCCTDTWLRARTADAPGPLAAEIARVEEEIAGQVEQVASLRAWSHAVVPERLPASMRVDLALHSHLLRRLGESGGSGRQRAELARVRDRCRRAVPAWFVPLHRLTDQVEVTPDVFDVVIVDDASLVGSEFTFLRVLAPRIVLIGEEGKLPHRPAGPADRLTRLSERYLHDCPHASSWRDPRQSLFGDARLRGGGRAALDEREAGRVERRRVLGLAAERPPAAISRFVSDVRDDLLTGGHEVILGVVVRGLHLDLVVDGPSPVALVCEAGTWHGREAYEQDLFVQRALERDGWRIHRVRESAYLLSPEDALAPVWEWLRTTQRMGTRARTGATSAVSI
ncbi:hypothetical protein [Mobilicoccus caccae]|uniref:Restriction endonuclease type II-like domain-containing protein n=1 Tax=Mobilicoccus caccae TaxID=1859295 RepID=A0ABQ6IUV6_9MICO|nr:hypothetical protein [Mobilicoccus caccae]GMA41441.1 hypothetical protein GCM10025883_34860 [Mobilicoccus caccae]